MIEWVSIAGLSEYNHVMRLVERRVCDIIAGDALETIYLLEHNDVYTAGTGFKPSELLRNDIPVIYTGRGGKFTYHGNGQRIIYPLLNLSLRTKDLHLYIKMLETWVINTLQKIGISAFTISDKIGVWIKDGNDNAKIAAIGIRVRKWVTYHGIAVNISTDVNKFKGIIPCGINNCKIASIANLGIEITFEEFDAILKNEFNSLFDH